MFQTLVPVLFRSQSTEIWKRPCLCACTCRASLILGGMIRPGALAGRLAWNTHNVLFFFSKCCCIMLYPAQTTGAWPRQTQRLSNLTIIRPLVTRKAFQSAAIFIIIYIVVVWSWLFKMIDSWLLYPFTYSQNERTFLPQTGCYIFLNMRENTTMTIDGCFW